MSVRDLATQRQIAAADPGASTWLAANAGSGKTRVLIDRVARLLLEQVPPQNILCMTYTKAAAGEMQNRLFARLGGWAMSPDDALREALSDLGVPGPITGDRLTAARRLFARAIEAPGGLRIQTIHAFCAALLRRFPLEAGVSPGFRELDDRSLSELSGDVLEEMASGSDTSAIDGLARYLSTDDLTDLTRMLLSHRDAFAHPLGEAEIGALFGLPPNYGDADLAGDVFTGAEDAMIDGLLPLLRAGSKTDQKAASRLSEVRASIPSSVVLPALEQVFLTGSGAKEPFRAKIGTFPTKATQAKMAGDALDDLADLMQRVEDARPRRIALAASRRSAALHGFAQEFLPAVAARKAEGGWLDFDDLILHTSDLLSDPAVSDWVLFKLDGGIDHILVDEAQDTSPEQWQVIQHLARELTVGDSARSDVPRTLFVVGDRKQSIYSFQGADPAAFDSLRTEFGAALTAAGGGLESATLEHSFRSVPAILNLVDRVFTDENAQGLGGDPTHRAFHEALPGRVDLWPAVEKPEKDPRPHWSEPVDLTDPRGAEAQLADAIAKQIADLIDQGETIPRGNGKRSPLTAGDVLILVQRRSTLFHELIRACKHHNLPLAGADRLVVTRDLAVKDVLALLSFLALPEDDLSLASVLRSPLLGWSEDALFRLANPRGGHLWAALRSSEDPAHADTLRMLRDLRQNADFKRPYDLIERILIRHAGREKLVARLGEECEEALDALLNAALSYEQADIPSLTGFLEWMQADAAEVKRQSEGAGDRLRIMTVHGAKGLEAPLVILPDSGQRRAPQGGGILQCDDGHGGMFPVWKSAAGDMPEIAQQAQSDWRDRQEEERMRLLYVALTRAETWLWVCAAGETEGGWYAAVEQAMPVAGAQAQTFPTGQGLRLSSGDWAAAPVEARRPQTTRTEILPHWAQAAAPAQPTSTDPVSPSKLGGEKALPGEGGQSESDALARGSALHRLLEVLPEFPEASWLELAPGLAGPGNFNLPELLAEATRVLTNPDLQFLISPDTLAEVSLTADLPTLGSRIFGAVDRLVVNDDRVLAVDFKSNAVVPQSPGEVPEGLVRQMGAYAEALAAIFRDRPIETAILWTRPAQLMPLPQQLTSAALRRAAEDTTRRTAP